MKTADSSNSGTPSLEAKLIFWLMGLFKMKKQMEKKISNNNYSKTPAELPKSILKKCTVKIEYVKKRKFWCLSPKNVEPNTAILYLHGGAYYKNISKMHWNFIEQVLMVNHATMYIPDYPLAPESNCEETYLFMDLVYEKICADFSGRRMVFMGDSAGGGIALGFALKIKNEPVLQPKHIILFSPWLDASMSNPEIHELDASDKLLSIKGLAIAGKKYAGNFPIEDYRLSPIHGNFSNLGRIAVFVGTNELFIADARKFKQLMENKGIEIDYFEYPKMFHDWVIIPNLREAKDVILKVAALLS